MAVRFARGGAEYRSTTLSIAWVAAGEAVVLVVDRDEPFSLALVRALASGETLSQVPRSSTVRAGGTR